MQPGAYFRSSTRAPPRNARHSLVPRPRDPRRGSSAADPRRLRARRAPPDALERQRRIRSRQQRVRARRPHRTARALSAAPRRARRIYYQFFDHAVNTHLLGHGILGRRDVNLGLKNRPGRARITRGSATAVAGFGLGRRADRPPDRPPSPPPPCLAWWSPWQSRNVGTWEYRNLESKK